ncbi:MAG TPA: zf-HC2 domain-containing protein [Longimicrobiales bacterium]
MSDTWTDRLSEYVDDELDAVTRAELETHLLSCDECRTITGDLRLIRATASRLENTGPSGDLWAGIAAEIGAGSAGSPADRVGTPADRVGTPAGSVRVIPMEPRTRRSFTFSIPQLAAAALIILGLGAALMWQIERTRSASRVAVDSPDSGAVRTVSTSTVTANEAGYDVAIEQLEQAAELNRDQLDSSTVRILNESMTTIDRALADARAALAADPANPYLHRHYDRTMKQKLEILRRAATIQRGGA